MHWLAEDNQHTLDRLQQLSLSLIAAMTFLTFAGTNLQALLWQSSDWLVGTVLPAVVVDLTNDQRGSYAAAPLRRNAVLDQAAAQKAAHMAANGYFAHFAPDGTSPWYFFDQAGYVYAHAGENLAIHFTDSAEVVAAWMNSPAHKENIVNARYTEIGVGTARGSFDGHDTVFVVQLFGTPAVSAPSLPVAAAPAPAPTPVTVTATEPADEAITLANLRAQLDTIQARADQLQAAAAPTTTDTVAVAEPTPAAVAVLTESPEEPQAIPPTEEAAVVPDTLVIESQLATSSGLAIASITEPPELHAAHAGATLAAAATRPNLVLDIIYSLLVGGVLVLLAISFWGEARRQHLYQAAYSVALLAGVGALWYAHTLLTSGAVIV